MTETSSPRLAPLPADQWTDELREMFAPIEKANGRVFNVFTTLARHPKLLKRWLVFANHCLVKSSLPPRERELVILRAGWLSRSEYEWAQHNRIAREEGLTDAEIERVKEGGGAPGWTAAEAALLKAVDELLTEKRLGDDAWAELNRHFSEEQVLDIIFTAGNYALLAMALNTLGVEVDDGV